MTEQAKAPKVEETAFKVSEEQRAPKAEAKEEGSKRSGGRGFLGAGREMAGQLIRPWFDATATTLEHVNDLQQRLFSRTQEAITGSFDMLQEGVGQCAKVTGRTHKIMQAQLKRFGTR